MHDDFSSVSLAELLASSNWQHQYRLITQWGKLVNHKAWLRVPAHELKGCETPAWLSLEEANGHLFWHFDSDSRVINGLAALLLMQIQGKSRQETEQVNFPDLLLKAGLEKHLTPSRNNGLHAIVRRIGQLASSS